MLNVAFNCNLRPYLEAAAAALRARIPLTAALLVEAWLEDRHGTVSLDDAEAAARNPNNPAKSSKTPTGKGAAAAAAAAIAAAAAAPAHDAMLFAATEEG